MGNSDHVTTYTSVGVSVNKCTGNPKQVHFKVGSDSDLKCTCRKCPLGNFHEQSLGLTIQVQPYLRQCID
jgi:hypothetical protein